MRSIAKFLAAILLLGSFSACKNDKKPREENVSQEVVEITDTTEIDQISEKIRESPRNSLLFEKRAELYAYQNNYEKAADDLEVALKLDPNKKEIYYNLIDFYMKLGQSGKAKKIAEDCLKKFPGDKESRIRLAQIYYYVKDYNKALQYIRELNSANQMDADSYFIEALIYRETGKLSFAITALQKTLEYDEEHIAAYIMLGKLLSEANDPLAVEYYRAGLRQAPDNIELHYNIGFYYQQNNAIDSALYHYELIINELDSLHYGAYYNSGFINLVYKENYDEAIKLFSDALKINPESYKAYYNKGYAYELKGDYSSARENYNTALKYKENYKLAVQGLNSLDNKN